VTNGGTIRYLVAAALLLVACGNNSDNSSSGTTQRTSSSARESTTTEDTSMLNLTSASGTPFACDDGGYSGIDAANYTQHCYICGTATMDELAADFDVAVDPVAIAERAARGYQPDHSAAVLDGCNHGLRAQGALP
jgi:hypothetical protein